MRNSVRFPLHLPVKVHIEAGGEVDAFTEDISATGVLFIMQEALAVNTRISWTFKLPGEIMGSADDVSVDCVGRVVWLGNSVAGCQVGAVIDDYKMGDRRNA